MMNTPWRKQRSKQKTNSARVLATARDTHLRLQGIQPMGVFWCYATCCTCDCRYQLRTHFLYLSLETFRGGLLKLQFCFFPLGQCHRLCFSNSPCFPETQTDIYLQHLRSPATLNVQQGQHVCGSVCFVSAIWGASSSWLRGFGGCSGNLLLPRV